MKQVEFSMELVVYGKKRTDPSQRIRLSLADIAKTAGVKPEEIATIFLNVQKGDENLFCETYPNERDYPGMYIGANSVAGTFTLAEAELPNQDAPDSFTTRLYAGCETYESDSPIAIVKSKCDGKRQNGTKYSLEDPLTKIVYVDTSLAAASPWNEYPEKMKEHCEDVDLA